MSQRFAFYGRVSTEDRQDPESSKQWQLSRSQALIGPHGGRIVAEFFDIGLTRALPWKRRTEAAALLATFKDPARGFDAVVIGEPARAFYGNQFGLTFPLFEHYGIDLWVPEVGGRIDPGSDAHELVMTMYGGMSKGERNRIKIRVRSSMAAQASTQGRYLGGRPPYGYVLADAGPHPNPGKAAVGQRAHRLVIDPSAAEVVRRIFAEYLTGRGVVAIANRLTREGVPCPSAHDRARNLHRSGTAWVGSAVAAILRNPRYTGYEVWNKQRKEEVLIDVEDVALGHRTTMNRNPVDAWIYSPAPVHERIISKETFDRTGEAIQTRGTKDATGRPERAPRHTTRPYLLRGVISCARCGRHMEGSWNNNRPHYRCRIKPADAALAASGHPRAAYVREDKIIDRIDAWLDDLFAPAHRDRTIEALHQAGTDPDTARKRQDLAQQLTTCQTKIARYRQALDAGADPTMVAAWTADVVAERARLTLAIDQLTPTGPVAHSDVTALVEAMSSLSTRLRRADPHDRADLYLQLGLHLSYEPAKKEVRAHLDPDPCSYERVRGGT